MFTMTAREFNQGIGRAQRIADDEPVLVTRHGTPAYVLISHAEYERLTGQEAQTPTTSAWEALRPRDDLDEDAEADFARIMDEIVAARAQDTGRPPVEW